jgi:hypothetical protein
MGERIESGSDQGKDLESKQRLNKINTGGEVQWQYK